MKVVADVPVGDPRAGDGLEEAPARIRQRRTSAGDHLD
jgi:hypothetical protein